MVDFSPLDFFREEVRNDDATIKISAVNQLNLIASALGPLKTVNELIPYVSQAVQEEPLCYDEEFLFTMAKQYAVLSDFINGQYDLLIAPLEYLAAQEETAIRDQAVDSLRTIVGKKPALVPEYLVPTVERLSSKTDFFTARVSACALFPVAYQHCKDSQKPQLRKAFALVCCDETPMVRRAAAHRLKEFLAVCDKQDILADMINVYKSLSQEDTQDTIRMDTIHATNRLAAKLSVEENYEHTVKVITDAAEDRSWRVRLTVAHIFDELCSAFGKEITASHLLAALVLLLTDSEQEVRKAAVKIIEACILERNTDKLRAQQLFTTDQFQEFIIPRLETLSLDPSQSVRAALASALGPMARALGRQATQESLLPLLANLMRDEFHEVRLNAVGHAGLMCEVLTVEGFGHSLLNTFQGLIQDSHWRIREMVVIQIPKLAVQFQESMYQSKLEPLLLTTFRDAVHSVRQKAVGEIKTIAETFGAAWTAEKLMPKIVPLGEQPGYANRVTMLLILGKVCDILTASQIEERMLPLVVKALKDSVPNVRFTACRTLLDFLKARRDLNSSTFKSTLLELKSDSDVDVQYYAQCALEVC